jgi:hypothetical protein
MKADNRIITGHTRDGADMTATDSYTNWERKHHEASNGLHAQLAQDLEAAARYIREHPDLPVPSSVDIHYCIPAGSDAEGENEAYRIAGILGAKVTGDDSSETGLDFGLRVRYRAVYISQDRAEKYAEHMAPYHASRIAEAAVKA